MEPIPRRPYGTSLPNGNNERLAKEVSIVGLGCSSFSHFFDAESSSISLDTLDKTNPIVQGWIKTIHFAVVETGINLLDTAPWYGHGTSEMVIGWAMEGLLEEKKDTTSSDKTVISRTKIPRNQIVLNTKLGRYEANPSEQFDFSRAMTLKSAQRSLERMQCAYIDVLQLHDPEFAPTLQILLEETIPAMMECQKKGWCRALGLTGFPLPVQYQIFQASLETFGTNVWDQALTYGHFNLHDSSLLYLPMSQQNLKGMEMLESSSSSSIPSFRNVLVEQHSMGVLAAAPLSMGLFTPHEPPEWHPADPPLQQACKAAKVICEQHNVNIASLAILYAISHPDIPCTLLGMKSIEQVQAAASLAGRLKQANMTNSTQDHQTILKAILTRDELTALEKIQDRNNGPFAGNEHWSWDGVEGAIEFWSTLGIKMDVWQQRQL
ncbi:unnamed protein product [Cylindrotheca closterium]|uniref:NADP-dependent oxidoreductase domain-containing protein n=1 Tax=Cylindrotheca closterium TaxID=2856 RepID=A0AAD2CIW0_9STRA|nr:unnamed protein product [Cylindrotheca closterium]